MTEAQCKYDPVGYCIYCGATDALSDEHILPFALSGTLVLPKSSCRKCAQITGEVERKVLRGPFWPLRVFRDLKSRSKHADAPASHSITVVRQGKAEELRLSLDEYPILLHFPEFSIPGYLRPSSYTSGIDIVGTYTVSFGVRPDDVARKLGAEKITLTQTQEPTAFARMLAKIAFASAAAGGNLGLLRGPSPVLPAVLGQTDDIGRWVGMLSAPIERHDHNLHRVVIHEDRERGLLMGEVHLFSDSQTPKYVVILGQLVSTDTKQT